MHDLARAAASCRGYSLNGVAREKINAVFGVLDRP
jgi:hypothetical protein